MVVFIPGFIPPPLRFEPVRTDPAEISIPEVTKCIEAYMYIQKWEVIKTGHNINVLFHAQ